MSTAASATMGRWDRAGVKNKRNKARHNAATRLDICDFAPALSLMVVRAWLPVTQNPCKKPLHKLAVPSAVNSWFAAIS